MSDDEKVRINTSETVPCEDADPKGVLVDQSEEFQPHTGDYEILDLLTDARTSLESMIDETTGGHGDPEDIEDGQTGALEALDKIEASSLFAVIKERARQNDKWGGIEIDDSRTLDDWVRWVKSRANVLELVGHLYGDYRGDVDLQGVTLQIDVSPENVRKLWVEIAALALAALESHDRRHAR